MPTENSIFSMDNPDDYFGGVSTTGSTLQWSPKYFSSFDETTNQPLIAMHWTQAVPGARFSHGVFFPTTAQAPAIPGPVLLRVLCHIIVNNIPDRGLPELFKCASEAYEFHAEETAQGAPMLPSSTQTMSAEVRATYERPSFHAVEE